MNTIIISVAAIIIHLLEALHDYAVIQAQIKENSALVQRMQKYWHVASAVIFFVFYLTLAIITKNVFILPLAATLRGVIFWPTLNMFLGRPNLYTSNHFMERWIAGKYLIIIYIVFAVSLFILSHQWELSHH